MFCGWFCFLVLSRWHSLVSGLCWFWHKVICRHRVPSPTGDMSFFLRLLFRFLFFGFQETGNISSVDFLCVILFGIGWTLNLWVYIFQQFLAIISSDNFLPYFVSSLSTTAIWLFVKLKETTAGRPMALSIFGLVCCRSMLWYGWITLI